MNSSVEMEESRKISRLLVTVFSFHMLILHSFVINIFPPYSRNIADRTKTSRTHQASVRTATKSCTAMIFITCHHGFCCDRYDWDAATAFAFLQKYGLSGIYLTIEIVSIQLFN